MVCTMRLAGPVLTRNDAGFNELMIRLLYNLWVIIIMLYSYITQFMHFFCSDKWLELVLFFFKFSILWTVVTYDLQVYDENFNAIFVGI